MTTAESNTIGAKDDTLSSPEARREAVLAMRQLASRNHLDGLSLKELIAEGRK